ncbi:MAG: hypothetical protein AAF126_15930 [Chloroflexota bacterium]
MKSKHNLITLSNMIFITNSLHYAIKDHDSTRWRIFVDDTCRDSADNAGIALAKIQDILEGMINE